MVEFIWMFSTNLSSAPHPSTKLILMTHIIYRADTFSIPWPVGILRTVSGCQLHINIIFITLKLHKRISLFNHGSYLTPIYQIYLALYTFHISYLFTGLIWPLFTCLIQSLFTIICDTSSVTINIINRNNSIINIINRS